VKPSTEGSPKPRSRRKGAVGALATGASQAFPGTTAPGTPAKGPSTDMTYLAHAFEALAPVSLGNWNVERIRHARDQHAQGQFESSAPLADAMLTDARIAPGLMQRLGPLLGIPREVTGGQRWNGHGLAEKVRLEAEQMFAPESTACPPGTLAAGFVSTAMLGPAILQNVCRGRTDGSRIDFETRPWPMQLSSWNEALKRYQVSTTDGLITVEPNDGKWIVIEPYGPRSFMYGALRSLALVWADRAYAQRDRSNHSAAHGSMSIIGTLPDGIATKDDQGIAFTQAIKMLQRARAGIVKAHGSSVEAFEPKTLAWQIFGQIVNSTNADIMLALNGISDSRVYKPISQIDGVRYDIVRTELGAATVGYNEGLLKPWTLLNFGDADVVPKLGWAIPDLREQERVDAMARRFQAYAESIVALQKANFDVTQDIADRIAERFGVEAPTLKPTKLPPAAGAAAAPATTEEQETEQIKRNDATTS
jgi:hypothetical protein